MFFVFGAFIFLSIVYVWFCVPETKDKTIKEVQEFFKASDKTFAESSSSKFSEGSKFKILKNILSNICMKVVPKMPKKNAIYPD